MGEIYDFCIGYITPQTLAQFNASECFDLIEHITTELDLYQLGDFLCDNFH